MPPTLVLVCVQASETVSYLRRELPVPPCVKKKQDAAQVGSSYRLLHFASLVATSPICLRVFEHYACRLVVRFSTRFGTHRNRGWGSFMSSGTCEKSIE